MRERFRFGIGYQLLQINLGFLAVFASGWLACYVALVMAGQNASPLFEQADPLLPPMLWMFIGSAVVAASYVNFLVFRNRENAKA